MAASVLHLLASLETHLERTKAELQALREENAQLKQQLAAQQPLPTPDIEQSPIQSQKQSQIQSQKQSPTPLQNSVAPASPVPIQPAVIAQEPPAASLQVPSVQEQPVQAVVNEKDGQAVPPSPQALLKQWYQRYPKAFFKGHTKPLKVGIHQDLAEREPWSGKLIRRALANYVNLPRYVKSMREGAERVDLDGQRAGTVDKEAALHANERRKEQPSKAASPAATKKTPQMARPAPTNTAKSAEGLYNKAVKPTQAEKSGQAKPLSLEEKLKGLQQKFEGR